MILTPIPPERLAETLDRFAAQLQDPAAQEAFARIRATSPDRSEGAEAERHQDEVLAVARRVGVPVHPPGTRSGFNWDGVALDPDTEAYVILHEIAHFVLAPPERRRLIDFGLGPGPDTRDRAAAERAGIVPLAERAADEAEASLLGILWEAALGQPALASFLDQNWLEGLERSAAAHFTAVFTRLRRRGLLDAPLSLNRDAQSSAREMR
jgi:Elongation factor P hydroxylase